MSREKSLVKNTFIITIGKVCTQLVSFFLLPLYTAILTTEEYGVIDLLNTLVSLLLPIVTFQIEQALFRELIEVRGDQEATSRTITTCLVTIFVQCAIYVALFLSISPAINNEYKYFLATNVISQIMVTILLQTARGLGDNKRYAIASFCAASCTIIFNILFLVFARLGANGMLLATLVSQTLASLYLVFSLKLYKYVSIKKYSKELRTRLWKYSIPLIPNAISWWIIDASDRVIVTSLLGVDQNGILSASLKFAALLASMSYIFSLSWTESIAVAINDTNIKDYFNRMLNTMLRLFIAISIGLIAGMPFLFPLLINEKYSYGYGLVPISVIATFFNVVVGLVSVMYVAKRNTKAIASTSMLSAIINIIVHLVLIRYIGLYAAVISSLAAFLTMSIYRIFDIRKKYFDIEINRLLVVESLVVLALILCVYYVRNPYLNVIALLCAIVFAWYINKDTLDTILKLAKRKVKFK